MEPQQIIGRYAIFEAIAAGGMATVYYGRLLGPVGFARTVAVKQLHPQFSRDPDFVSMFVDEARLAARLRHPNVVPVLDVVKHGRELYLIMDYVLGVSLSELLRRVRMRDEMIPREVVAAVLIGALEGLHAAHETRDEAGIPLGIVHRDVSPANILVARDGLARVLDFGIAKAAGRAQVTRHGEVKGKVGYMAPEQLRGDAVTRAADLFAMGVTLWEALTGQRGFVGDADDILEGRLDGEQLPLLTSIDPTLAAFEPIVSRGVAESPQARWPSARAMAEALAGVTQPASPATVARWIEEEAGVLLEERARVVAALEAGASASEVRAAIRKDLDMEAPPSISVDTWSGSEDELAGLWAGNSQVFDSRDEHAAPRPGPRDDVPTKVESTDSARREIAAPPVAPSLPLPLLDPAAGRGAVPVRDLEPLGPVGERDLQLDSWSSAEQQTARTHVVPTPSWQEMHPSEAPPGTARRAAGRPRPPIGVMAAATTAAVVLIIGAVIALSPDEPAPGAAGVDASVTTAAVAPEDEPVAPPPIGSSEGVDLDARPEPAPSSAPSGTPSEVPRPRAKAPSKPRAEPKPSGKKKPPPPPSGDDPFGDLGGRL
ncbi:MAG: protein kinase [Myxococcales bacterium]|nr:protein kinase [Myxococcales bacterium]